MTPSTSSSRAYRRVRGSVFRWVRGSVLVAAPARDSQKLRGTAALVWMTLDTPGSVEQVEERIALSWPDLEVTEPGFLHDAVVLLTAAELIEPVEPLTVRSPT